MTDPVFVKDLTKTFYDESRGPIHAVQQIDFTCRPGEIFGLLGANGAGKTTTLRMLTTILKPTSGTAKIMGHDVAGEPVEVRRRLGFYSATTALYPRLTARETIEFFARINKYPASETPGRVDELIERFGIGDYAAHTYRQTLQRHEAESGDCPHRGARSADPGLRRGPPSGWMSSTPWKCRPS